MQDVLLARVFLQQSFVDALLVPEGLQLRFSLHGVRALSEVEVEVAVCIHIGKMRKRSAKRVFKKRSRGVRLWHNWGMYVQYSTVNSQYPLQHY